MSIVKRMLFDLVYLFLNYFVANIPAWWFRRAIYTIFGMKIGHGARINMKCTVISPWKIQIGNNTAINEFVTLDGRGGLTIGNDCSISINSIIFTASHHVNSESFEYYKRSTIIGDGVWVGARAVINAGTVLNNKVIIGANSTTSSNKLYQENGVYVGVPAEYKFDRKLEAVSIKTEAFFR